MNCIRGMEKKMGKKIKKKNIHEIIDQEITWAEGLMRHTKHADLARGTSDDERKGYVAGIQDHVAILRRIKRAVDAL